MCEAQISLDDYVFQGEAGVTGLKRAPPPKEENKENK
jgi:hypothetical protein